MKANLYYTTPDQAVFDEVMANSICIWEENHSDEYGYVTEKVKYIKDVNNVENNMMVVISRFDMGNQILLSSKLCAEARLAICERLTACGMPDHFNVFMQDQ